MKTDELQFDVSLNPDPLFSMKEAATYLGISVSAMYEIGKRENLPVVKLTSDKKVRKSVLDAYISKCETTWGLVKLGENVAEFSK